MYFLLTVFPVIEYSEDVLSFIGFEGKLTELITNLQKWLAPAFLIKMVTDQLKAFFFCHRKFNIIGLLNLIGMAIVAPFIYLRSKQDSWKSSDLGWALIIYELINLVMCYIAYRINFSEQERKDECSLKYCIRLELDWFTWEFFKNIFTEIQNSILKQIVIFVVSLTGSKAQIASFADLSIVLSIMIQISVGFYVYPRSKINTIHGMYVEHRRDPNPQVNNGLDFFKQLFKAISVIGTVISAIMCGVCVLIAKNLRSEVHSKWIVSIIFLFGFCSMLIMYTPFLHGVLRSLDHKYFLIVYNSVMSLIVLPIVMYKLTISHDFALFGVFAALVGELLIRILVFYFVIVKTNWKNRLNYIKEIASGEVSKNAKK